MNNELISELANDAVICGYGIVGKVTAKVLGIKDWIDKIGKDHIYYFPPKITVSGYIHKPEKKQPDFLKRFKYWIICVPTPNNMDDQQDKSAIIEWLDWIEKNVKCNPIVIIRSTILPNTCSTLCENYSFPIVHVPEFLSEATALEDTQNPELFFIGADDILVAEEVKRLFKPMWENAKYKAVVSSPTAEVIKYAMNSWFALKVIYANQLWDLCSETTADYSQIRKALEKHKWGSKNGWDVWHKGFRGFGGKCLPKDLEALVNSHDLPLLKTVQEINDQL